MFNRLLRKAAYSVLGLRDERGWGLFAGFGDDGVVMSEKLALEVSAVFCAVRVIAEGLAQMPRSVKQEVLVGGVREVREAPGHWAQPLLQRRPNSWQSPYEFVENMLLLAALFGEYVAVKDMPRQPTELIPVVNGSWTVRRKADNRLVYRVTFYDGESEEIDQQYVLHLRGPSLDSYRGLAPVLYARRAIALAGNLEKHQSRLAQNGGRPSGIISSDMTLNQETKDRLKRTWDEKFGPDGMGGVAVLDGGWKFASMTMTSVDAQHLETRKYQIEEIARAFRVFPQMLMQTDKAATFASAESFFRAHVIHCLGPWVERTEAALNRDLLGQAEMAQGYFVDFDEENLMRGDLAEQADYFQKALGAGGTPAWMTQNEVRAKRGLNPVANGDRLSAGAMDGAAGAEGQTDGA